MTKTQFFRVCAESHQPDEYTLSVNVYYDERAMRYVVRLFGSFCNGGLAHHDVYSPQVYRNGAHSIHACALRCARELPKYQQWLDEYKRENGLP